MTVQEQLNRGLQSHHAGRLAEAETIYRQILGQYPEYADALHLLGVLAHQTGHRQNALELIGRAIQLSPQADQYHTNMAIVLDALGRYVDAAAEFEKAAELKPYDPDVLGNLAASLVRAKRLEQAIATARRVIALRPASADAHAILAGMLRDTGQTDEAVEYCNKALQLDPSCAAAYNTLGYVLHGQRRFDEAIAAYQKAVAIKPDFAQAYGNLALAYGEKRKWEPAIAACRRALEFQPDNADYYATLGHFYCGIGEVDQAMAACQKAIAMRPDLQRAYVNLTVALRDSRQWEAAVTCARDALARWPEDATLHNAMGHALIGQDRNEEALVSLHKALAIKPDFALAFNNLGYALDQLGRLDESIAAYAQALKLEPDFAEAYSNLGNAYCHNAEYDKSVASFQKALTIYPDFASAHWNMGLLFLLRGDYSRGWPEYEWRYHVKSFGMRTQYTKPIWAGEELGGRRIMLHAEQGFGDIIQFSRYVPLVAQRGGKIIFVGQKGLNRLFKQTWPFVECFDAGDTDPEHDLHCPVMTLPKVFMTQLETIPPAPYLRADAALAAQWRARLPIDGRLKVGLVWANKPNPANRCPPQHELTPLTEVRNVWFCSLQKDLADQPPPGLEMADWTAEINDFSDTAALMANLDLVVTVDTAVAHLAGAMGKPVWVMLKHVPDWRWLLDRRDSPWYPSVRLFRQPKRGDWTSLIREVIDELNRAAAGQLKIS